MIRVGLGHDTHRLGPGTALVLGGIAIPHDRKALGHSDADVLLHAITDSLLGAAALGDIGELFPDLDCVIFAQRPKILPHRAVICSRVAAILGIDVDRVWLKAKTGEKVGPIGEELAIGAECVVLIERD